MPMRGVAVWVTALVFAALAVRLAFFIDQYAINLLYYDEWDYLNGLFEGTDAWTLFRRQHGPQRQGLGNLILAVVLDASGWNSRVVVAASAVAMALAGVAGIAVVKRVCGQLRPWDAIVLLLFLTTTTVDSYTVTPNLAHGPLPALLLTSYALSLTVHSHAARAALITAINFLAVNTGFTLLLGPITTVVLLFFACQPDFRGRDRAAYAAAGAASIATVALFASGLRWAPAVNCFQFPHDPPWLYVPYAGRIVARPLNYRSARCLENWQPARLPSWLSGSLSMLRTARCGVEEAPRFGMSWPCSPASLSPLPSPPPWVACASAYPLRTLPATSLMSCQAFWRCTW